jgi:hypothetical protein
MKKFIKYFGILGAFIAVAFSAQMAFAALGTPSNGGVVMSKINAGAGYNNNLGYQQNTLGVNPGDTVGIGIYFHNTSSTTTLTNVRVRLSPQTTGSGTSHTFQAIVSADNATSVSGSTNISLTQSQSMAFDSVIPGQTGKVYVYYDKATQPSQATIMNGADLFGSGLLIGNLAPTCSNDYYCHQGTVILHFKVSNNQTPTQTCLINSFTANPTSVNSGSSSNLNWQTTGCTSASVSGPNVSSNQLSGSIGTGALYGTSNYILTAYGTNGVTQTANVSVGVLPQQPTQNCYINWFNASPSQVTYGGSSTLSWSTTGCTSAYLTGGNISSTVNTTDSRVTGAVYGTTSYTLTATGINSTSQTTSVYTTNQQPIVYQCNDGIDNDGDGRIDMNDVGCTSYYDNDEYNYVQVTQQSVATTVASPVTASAARLNGLMTQTSGYGTNVYFEYGPTASLGFNTGSQNIGTSLVSFYDTITNLTPDTTYYFRAVANSTQGTVRGDILSFRTGSVVTTNTNNTTTIVRTIVQTQGTGSGSNLIELKAKNRYENICVGDFVDYDVTYKNISGRTLNNVVLHIILPKDIELRNSSSGIYNASDHTITLPIGTLVVNQEGVVFVAGRVLRSALDRDLVVLTATIAFSNPTTTAQESATVYALNNTDTCNNDFSLAGLALFGGGFFPNTLFGWLLLLLIILGLIYLATRLYERNRNDQNTKPRNQAPHYEEMNIPRYDNHN